MRGFAAPSCAVATATRASKPRFSQRKFSHASTVPIARPSAQDQCRRIATTPAAAPPSARVNHAIRRSVRAKAAASFSPTIALAGCSGLSISISRAAAAKSLAVPRKILARQTPAGKSLWYAASGRENIRPRRRVRPLPQTRKAAPAPGQTACWSPSLFPGFETASPFCLDRYPKLLSKGVARQAQERFRIQPRRERYKHRRRQRHGLPAADRQGR